MKTLEIEWRHLDQDGRTCLRCSDTLQSLQQVIAQLAAECRCTAWRDYHVPRDEIATRTVVPVQSDPVQRRPAGVGFAGRFRVGKRVSVPWRPLRPAELLPHRFRRGHTARGHSRRLVRQAACIAARCC
ncbi:MAG: DUF2703 domain-containing protein [Candidatus Competibacteraceae bacterium]